MMTAKQIKVLEQWDKDMDKPEAKPPVAGSATCSPCVVCGSPLTLKVMRAIPVVMVHCNTCGSEVPYHVTQKLNLYKARGKTAASMENAALSGTKEKL